MDETFEDGPVFVVDAVRLVLPGGSHHFRRLDPCTKCGKETVGAPILGRHDLHRAGQPVICRRCVRSAGLVAEPMGSGGTPFREKSPAEAGEEVGDGSDSDVWPDDR